MKELIELKNFLVLGYYPVNCDKNDDFQTIAKCFNNLILEKSMKGE